MARSRIIGRFLTTHPVCKVDLFGSGKITDCVKCSPTARNVLHMVASLVIQKYWTQSHLTTASSGEQALELLATQDFDVVLMDIQMPEMDGLQTTRELRRFNLDHQPVVVASVV